MEHSLVTRLLFVALGLIILFSAHTYSAPFVTVQIPNGGEIFVGDSNIVVDVNGYTSITSVNVTLRDNGGGFFQSILNDTNLDDAVGFITDYNIDGNVSFFYEWDSTEAVDGDYLIRALASGSANEEDTSDAVFHIRNPDYNFTIFDRGQTNDQNIDSKEIFVFNDNTTRSGIGTSYTITIGPALFIDDDAPVITFTEPTSGQNYEGTLVTFTIDDASPSSEIDYTVLINGVASTSFDPDTVCSTVGSLTTCSWEETGIVNGASNTISVSVIDGSGNPGNVAVTFNSVADSGGASPGGGSSGQVVDPPATENQTLVTTSPETDNIEIGYAVDQGVTVPITIMNNSSDPIDVTFNNSPELDGLVVSDPSSQIIPPGDVRTFLVTFLVPPGVESPIEGTIWFEGGGDREEFRIVLVERPELALLAFIKGILFMVLLFLQLWIWLLILLGILAYIYRKNRNALIIIFFLMILVIALAFF